MKRKIIQIDRERCNGCGACAEACHEGAIGMVDGKARLLRDDYCDGLGDCLPACPVNAITFTEREAAAYDEEAVRKHLEERDGKAHNFAGCPGSRMRQMHRTSATSETVGAAEASTVPSAGCPSQLRQWPCQIRLVPVGAPYFDGAKLLIAADCTAYAYAGMHEAFMRDRITLIGCPKLDAVDYAEKLTQILKQHDIQSVTVVRMEVPCCGGLEMAVKTALQQSGKIIPWRVVTVSVDGTLLEN